MTAFKLHSTFTACGDQPKAIFQLNTGVLQNKKQQVLLGVTGSGKTFTMANIIEKVNLPTLVIAHNKVLAGQLFTEFKNFFPENAVEYFVSYYDYYQPEAYMPTTDTYIEKDAAINEEIDMLRHSATHSLLERNDVIIVASVSCIFGLGDVNVYHGMVVYLEQGMVIDRETILKKLVTIQYKRNDYEFYRGNFRVRGDVIEIFPIYEEEKAIRVELFGDVIEKIEEIDPIRNRPLKALSKIAIYPGSHYVTPQDRVAKAVKSIQAELHLELNRLKGENKLVEFQRLEQRTYYDLEMLEQFGYCNGIENYSRHLTGRTPGAPPPTLIDYFPKGRFLMFIDESHQTIPQLVGMYRGDRSRKQTLVEYGFRLPSALDNRPLRFDEFEQLISQVIYVSATPGEYELKKTEGQVVEQIIRPTGLLDPQITVKPATHQVDDLVSEIKARIGHNERILVTTLTKRMAEKLTEYFCELEIRAKYLHSDVETLERMKIIRDLRKGDFDVLVGINLLREGLDIPEVSLVAILDADKEGFLRGEKALIQTCGRAARHIHGSVIMYADHTTRSMQVTLTETERRRKIQEAYNQQHGITPKTIVKQISDNSFRDILIDYIQLPEAEKDTPEAITDVFQIKEKMESYKKEMLDKARQLKFEEAAQLRDKILLLEKQLTRGWGL